MAPYKNMYSRWHRYRDADGEKQIKRFGTTEVPNPVQEAGFTAWMRGTGPMTQAQYENVVKGIRRVCLGIPRQMNTARRCGKQSWASPNLRNTVPTCVGHNRD